MTITKSSAVEVSLMVLLKISIAWAIESSACGQLPHYNSPQLTHASTNVIHYWPWHAAIFYRLSDSDKDYRCGGTLVNENWILTAAHCVFQNGAGVNPNEISVSLGRVNLAANESRSEQSFDITEVIVHEKYVPAYLDNDIALVRLSHTATFNHFVQPICLWRSNETDLSHVIDKYGLVVGWGRTEKYQISEILQEARFIVVTHGRCLESNREFYTAFITARNFCAGWRNGTSVCDGDSGGSMTFEKNGSYYIRGIVSSSPSKTNHSTQQLDCDTMEYAIYTDVTMHLEWIGENMDCETNVQCSNDSNRVSVEMCLVSVVTKPMCKIIFGEIPDPIIKSLIIDGEMESIPDLSDAIVKFENLKNFRFNYGSLKVAGKGRLTALKGIKQIDLSYNQIAELEVDSFGAEVSDLSLKVNKLKELDADTFQKLTNLEILDLSENRIVDLPAGLFHGNKKLREIKLFLNLLTELHVDLFKELYNLEIIELNNNRLQNLPQSLFRDNERVQKLHLGGNFLNELHIDLFKELDGLIELDLSHNQLKILPVFHKNRNLKKISVNDNSLKELHSDTFTGADNLTELYLQKNILESLPNGLFRNNEKVEKIYLTGNLLKEVHVDTFKDVANLKTLYLAQNKLEHLPPGIFRNNQKLEEIDLFKNILKELPADTFSKLDNLTVLHLRDNTLEILPQGLFRDNRKLQTIYLNENMLQELYIDTFEALNILEVLHLSGNKLEHLPNGLFRNNQNLQTISLDRNLLKELHGYTFKGLHNLKVLNLQDNKLENLAPGLFFTNTNLQRIDLSRNLLSELHYDIFQGLYSLTVISLGNNKLETLPPGLFSDNRNLSRIHLPHNFIDRVESDFSYLSNLELLDLTDNECIDEIFAFNNFRLSNVTEVNNKIQAGRDILQEGQTDVGPKRSWTGDHLDPRGDLEEDHQRGGETELRKLQASIGSKWQWIVRNGKKLGRPTSSSGQKQAEKEEDLKIKRLLSIKHDVVSLVRWFNVPLYGSVNGTFAAVRSFFMWDMGEYRIHQ